MTPAEPAVSLERVDAPHFALPRPQSRARPRFPGNLLRSAGVRFAFVYAVMFSISAFMLATFLWWSTAGLLDRQTEAAINADSQGLAERYADSGLVGLHETIDQRIAGNVDDDAIYLLVDPSFREVAGNLDHWPKAVTMDQTWFELPIERSGVRGLARIHQFELPGGFHLLVGRDVEVRAQMRQLLTGGLVWGAVVGVVLGSIGAWAVRGLFRMTLADVSATATAISAGDLSRRVRISRRSDEFDMLAEAINDMLDRIVRLMDGVRQVSNAIAHDLRTPIARARARLEDASIHARGEADLRAALERAQSDLDGVTAIFEALLRIAEIEAGARRSAFADIDLAPVLLDLADFYGAAAEERGLRLRTDIPDTLPAHGDRSMVQQAVANLVDNALKFSPEGGGIGIAAHRRPDGIEIVVTDQGPGIPEADRDRAVERFYRGEQARNTPGWGLGLSLVQAVATLHGGSLRLEDNAPGLRAVVSLARPAERRA